MQIDGKEATSGTFVVHPNEIVTIDTAGGPLAFSIHVDGGEPSADWEDERMKLKNFTNEVGSSYTFGAGLPGGGVNVRLFVHSTGQGALTAVHYTAVST